MPGKKRIPGGLYSASEATKLIGVSPSTFYNLVNSGKIKRITPDGKREGGYSKREVNLYVRNMKAIEAPYENSMLDFGLALAEDLPYVFDLVASVSGGPNHAVPEEVLRAWIRKNPQSIHVLRRRNEVLGYVSGFILPIDTLMKRLDGTLLNREIPIDDLVPFDATDSAPFYIAEMAVKPSQKSIDRGNPTPDDYLGASLIKHTARFILGNLKTQGVNVNELYAVGQSEFGIAMCKKLGMHPMSFSKGVRSDRMPCKISIAEITSQSPLFNKLAKRAIAA